MNIVVCSVLVGKAGKAPVAGVGRLSSTKVRSKMETSNRWGTGVASEPSEQAEITTMAQQSAKHRRATAGHGIIVITKLMLSAASLTVNKSR